MYLYIHAGKLNNYETPDPIVKMSVCVSIQ